MNCTLGQEVGYSIRFEDITSEKTKIKFLTDGLLLREMLVDPLLKRYSVVMVDEAHERSLSSDILLGLLKKVLKKRPDLRIVISSATLDAEMFLDFFAPEEGEKIDGKSRDEYCRIVSIEGREHQVDLQFLAEPAENYVESAVETVMEIHKSEDKGDILLFLTGRDEIEDAIEMISDNIAELPPAQRNLQPLPLYAGLPTDQQMYVFQPAAENTRKVIVSTNIAEASVTIDGIVYVIDCGFVKLRAYDAALGVERLNIVPVSKASATQRAGRAGRTRPGKCFFLFQESAWEHLDDTTFPEIQRSNLTPVVLQLMNFGVNPIRFDYISPPPSALVIRALDVLYSLRVIDDHGRLTRPIGLRMGELPLEPMLAKALLNSPSFGCLSEMLTIAAMITLQGSTFVSHDGNKKSEDRARAKFAVKQGDHITLYNVYETFIENGGRNAQWCRDNFLNYKALLKAVSVRKQLRRYLERFGIVEQTGLSGSNVLRAGGSDLAERVQRCLTTGFFAHAARMKPDGSFQPALGNTTLWAHPSSVFFVSIDDLDQGVPTNTKKHRKADWVIFHEVLETKAKIYIRDLTTIKMDWLTEYAPEYYRIKK
jgi:ATP-dependent RNA helicase DDX35